MAAAAREITDTRTAKIINFLGMPPPSVWSHFEELPEVPRIGHANVPGWVVCPFPVNDPFCWWNCTTAFTLFG
jgi:hypothetical protein